MLASQVALFGENGPCSVNADGSDTVPNKYSWNSQANVLYIDQPAGTGEPPSQGVGSSAWGEGNFMRMRTQPLVAGGNPLVLS